MHDEDLKDLLQQTRRLLQFHQSLGIDAYPRSPGLEHFARKTEVQEPGPKGKPAGPGGKPSRRAAPAQARTEPQPSLEQTRNELADCTRCRIHEYRTRRVLGTGNENAELLIVSDWQESTDDQETEPFGGEAGELLTRMLAAIGQDRADVYLTNLVKCNPAECRPPTAEEIRSCLPFLHREIAAVSPRVICTMGPLAAATLLDTDKPLFQVRGRFHPFKNIFGGKVIPLMPTFHPAFLLKNIELKKACWEDLQKIQKECQGK